MTYGPFLGGTGAAEWIASLGASPASPSRLLDAVRAATTSATSGPPSGEPLLRYDPQSSSLRMSQASFMEGMDMSPTPSRLYQTLPGWGMTRGGALWALGTWAHPTAENDGSAWPTPDGAVIEGDTKWKERRVRELAKGRNGNGFGLTLAMRVSEWPTPQSMDVMGQRSDEAYLRSKQKGGTRNLREVVVREWPTPQVVDLPNKNAHIKRWGGLNSLTTMAEAKGWPTPEAHSGGHSGEGYGPNIREAVEQWGVGRQAHRTPMPGQPSSETAPTSRQRLNPRFVEWLQGFPVGWTERSA
jgi:hypothetical protein